ncbi:MAG: pyridoxal kinase PdxY [Pseudomonadota bacterium]|nr:pyridoxal kinase PdxY [Pseudomonadota bacterium]
MGAILSIQSHVVYGHVGNSAVVFALQRLGREVWPIDTVQFSSHAGYPGWRGETFAPALIGQCVAGLDAIGQLARCEGVVTGYLGQPEMGQGALAAVAAVRARNPAAAYACDPVIGDEGRGVYVRDGVAEFFRDRALPAATIVSPNAFELAWLTGQPCATRAGALAALQSLRAKGPAVAFATSLKLEDTPADALDLIAVDAEGAWRVRTPKLPIAVNGAGDLVSALFLHEWLGRRDSAAALASASARVYAVVAATARAGARELQLVAAQAALAEPPLRFTPQRL